MVRISSEKMVKVKKHNSPSNKHFWRNKCVEFCKSTDLHGYKYIVMEGFNKIERVCWAFSVFVSIVIATYFVVTAYMWYAKNPIVTVIESTQGAIWDVPFPAITICDLNLVSRKAAWDLAYSLRLPANVTADFVFETLRLIPLLHTALKANTTETEQLNQLQDILDLNNMTVHSLFQKLSPGASCSQLVQTCMWKNTIYRCEELFREIFTLLSVCCTFNYFAIDEKIGNEQETIPRRVASCGYQTALTVLLYTNADDYYSATVASKGVVVIIESAYNVPDLDSPVRILVPSTEVLIGLSPERTYATHGIKSFSPEERQCYYSDEVKIDNFREYSFHNCMAHRKIQMYKRKCGCVPLFLPSDASFRNCNFKDMECIQSAAESLEQDYINHNLSEGDTIFFKCLPLCEHYDYPLEVALSKLADNVIHGLPINNATLVNSSLLNVFFNDLVSTRYRRDVYLNWQNLLSAFGGLLSLMLGFTLISGFDSIMFFTVRVAYNAYKSWLNDKKVHTEVNVQDVLSKGGWVPPADHNKVTQKYSNDYYDYDRY